MPRTSLLQAGLTALAALALFSAHPAHAQLSFTYQSFQPPAAYAPYGSGASGISASGAVSGTYFDSAGNYHAYVRSSAGVFTTIDYPGGTQTDTLTGGINNAGYVIGDSFKYDAQGNYQYVADFIYNSNTGTFLSPHAQINGVDAGTTGLQNVNEAGIVGVQYSVTPGNGVGTYHNASYNIATGTFTYYADIAGYDNAMQAVGPNGELLINLNPLNGATGGSHGSLTRNGVTTMLDFPGAYGTNANAINSAGLISGNYRDSAQNPFAFIYDSNSSTYYNIAYPGATETRLFHGNSDNQFAGYYVDANGAYHSLIVTATPEPGSVALLLGMTVTGAGFLARRARKRCA